MTDKEIALNQLLLNTFKPSGMSPLELRKKLLKLKNKKFN